MQNPYIHVHVHVLNACCSQAGYLSCVVHRYSEASIGKRFDSCVARLGARVEVEMKPVCSSDPGSWRRGGVDSNLQRRFRSLYVKALFVLIRHVLRRWGPRPGHLRVEAPTGSHEKGRGVARCPRQCLIWTLQDFQTYGVYTADEYESLAPKPHALAAVWCNFAACASRPYRLFWRAGAALNWATYGAQARLVACGALPALPMHNVHGQHARQTRRR